MHVQCFQDFRDFQEYPTTSYIKPVVSKRRSKDFTKSEGNSTDLLG